MHVTPLSSTSGSLWTKNPIVFKDYIYYYICVVINLWLRWINIVKYFSDYDPRGLELHKSKQQGFLSAAPSVNPLTSLMLYIILAAAPLGYM